LTGRPVVESKSARTTDWPRLSGRASDQTATRATGAGRPPTPRSRRSPTRTTGLMPCRRRRNRPSRLAWRRRPGSGLRAGGPLRRPAQGIRPSARPSRARARPGSHVGAAWLTASLPTTSPVSRWILSLTGPIGAIRDLPELRPRYRLARVAIAGEIRGGLSRLPPSDSAATCRPAPRRVPRIVQGQ
jgi:hypothetical protein